MVLGKAKAEAPLPFFRVAEFQHHVKLSMVQHLHSLAHAQRKLGQHPIGHARLRLAQMQGAVHLVLGVGDQVNAVVLRAIRVHHPDLHIGILVQLGHNPRPHPDPLQVRVGEEQNLLELLGFIVLKKIDFHNSSN